MKHNYSARFGNVLLRPLAQQDIENLRTWRNNFEQTRFLRPIGYITPEMQQQWFEKYLGNENEIAFAIVETKDLNRMVGSVALYDFDGGTAEIGKIQVGDPEASGRGIGRLSFVLAMWIGFRKLGLKKIICSVHQKNIPSHTNIMRVGFSITGTHPSVVGGIEDECEIDEVRLCEANAYIPEIELDVF